MWCPCGGCETDKTSGVFSVSIPGLLKSLQVSVPKGVPTAKAPPKALLLKR
ncbi:colicin-like bacteriocin tRNase domain-containing protein [Klebsiella pneumoniae]|uniref:colicin-like bacteriocin tRNase domain-containing protein n=1 Tax=Klebsiella pneumoniae TaxID=573 RepID=UPI003B288A96